IVHGTIAAPQVYNSYMVRIANNSRESVNLVTVNPAMPRPFNSASYVLGRVKGAPDQEAFGGKTTTYWYNVWQSQGPPSRLAGGGHPARQSAPRLPRPRGPAG